MSVSSALLVLSVAIVLVFYVFVPLSGYLSNNQRLSPGKKIKGPVRDDLSRKVQDMSVRVQDLQTQVSHLRSDLGRLSSRVDSVFLIPIDGGDNAQGTSVKKDLQQG